MSFSILHHINGLDPVSACINVPAGVETLGAGCSGKKGNECRRCRVKQRKSQQTSMTKTARAENVILVCYRQARDQRALSWSSLHSWWIEAFICTEVLGIQPQKIDSRRIPHLAFDLERVHTETCESSTPSQQLSPFKSNKYTKISHVIGQKSESGKWAADNE